MDFYKVLHVESDCQLKEIQKSYQKLCLLYHPDKNKSKIQEFYKIQKAYEILSNPESRNEYDLMLLKSNKMGPVQEDLDLDEMDYDDNRGIYSSPCRCGGEFSVTEDQLEGGVGGIECSRCSLCVKLLYQLAEED
jgi:diphthamide biosynthesis protein 4